MITVFFRNFWDGIVDYSPKTTKGATKDPEDYGMRFTMKVLTKLTLE